ncbi:iron uptake transporter deferrochelatase/peroxidase subunit [Nocardioides insulae]|uniref:iron uptake transporter deferrochelatase/peroxidase subunit n=1 Tax=Nocardioides insulae TaxID=394734 RepID=UPI00040276B7|nr:iron uptake transporter deferrochelatase/peroxidase subunit [Nocardioides insulae]
MKDRARLSRRGLLGSGAAVAGVAGAFALGRVSDGSTPAPDAGPVTTYPYFGEHQAGIITPAQDRLHFVALDLTTEDRGEVVDLLERWTESAARMTQGAPAGPVGPVEGAAAAPPDDTGEAIGLPASRLTITFGFGPGLFTDAEGRDRFGLADRRPEALTPLPTFSADVLDPRRTGGDLCIQACADDPQVAVHAIRNLVRMGFGTTAVRWSQLGFGRTSTTSVTQATPRNLFGFKDGTANLKAEETSDLDAHLWVGAGDDPPADWLAGGSYLVSRRINMTIEVWDRQPLESQELFVGRTKGAGAPLSGGEEFTEPDFAMAGSAGPVIPTDAHIRVVHPSMFDGARMLRRGYNFVDGSNDLGGLDAGLFFLAYVRDPRTHFIPQQRAMATNDALMEYLRFTGQAVFAVPPGVAEGGYIGQGLFSPART